jgi:hypothetical protein
VSVSPGKIVSDEAAERQQKGVTFLKQWRLEALGQGLFMRKSFQPAIRDSEKMDSPVKPWNDVIGALTE